MRGTTLIVILNITPQSLTPIYVLTYYISAKLLANAVQLLIYQVAYTIPPSLMVLIIYSFGLRIYKQYKVILKQCQHFI